MSVRNDRRLAGVLVFGLAAAVASAQPQPQLPPVGNGSISGSVTNSATGAPVPRAHVTVIILGNMGSQSFGATTGIQGDFAIDKLPPGRYILNVDRAGFVSPGNRLSDSPLRQDEKKEDLKLTLTPTGAISGRVLNAAGGEVQGAIISLDGAPFGVAPATSDEKGLFRISGVPPGRYRVVANPAVMPFPPEIRTDGTEEVHYARTYYPDGLTAKTGQRVEVAAGAELRGIDIRLVRTPIVTLKGKVVGMPAGGKTQVRAVASAEAGGGVQMANNVKADGSFQIWQLDPGKYTVVAISTPPGASSQRSVQSTPVEVDVAGEDIGNIEMRMIEPFDVTARLAFDDAKSRERPAMATQPPGQPPAPPGAIRQPLARRMMVRPEGQTFSNSPSVFQTVDLSDDDSITLEKLLPGRYRLSALWGVYVKSVSLGGNETEGDILDLRSGPTGDLTITLSSETGEVSGVVSDSSGPVAGVRVVMIGEGSPGRLPTSTMSGSDGTYKFAAVPPGKYRLIAGDDEIVAQFRPGVEPEEYGDLAESVEVHAGEKITRALRKSVAVRR